MKPEATSGTAPVSWGVKLPNCGGVLCPPDWARPDTILELARRADDLGFDAVWLHDHLVTPAELRHLDPDFHEPLMTMAVIATSVPRVQVGVATIIAPLRDPVLLAKQIATLAAFHPGRFLIGLGAGRYASEFESLGLDTFARRGPISTEHLQLVRALMTDDAVTHAGETRTLRDVHQRPRPVPRPPVFYAGNVAVAARRAARHADGWIGASMPAAELRETVEMMQAIRADEGIDGPFELAYSTTVVRQDAVTAAAPRAGDGPELHLHASALVGDAPSIAEQLAAYVDAGVTYFQLSLRSETLEGFRENLAWFASEVIPAVPAATRPAP